LCYYLRQEYQYGPPECFATTIPLVLYESPARKEWVLAKEKTRQGLLQIDLYPGGHTNPAAGPALDNVFYNRTTKKTSCQMKPEKMQNKLIVHGDIRHTIKGAELEMSDEWKKRH